MKALLLPLGAALFLAGCATSHKNETDAAPVETPPDPAEAKAFVARVNQDLKALSYKAGTAEWIKNTYITDDTERNAAWANDMVLAYINEAVDRAKRYKDVADLDPETEHQPVTSPGEPCICVAALDAPLRFPGWFARRLQPLFGV